MREIRCSKAVCQSCMRLGEERIAVEDGAVHLVDEERAAHGVPLANLCQGRLAAAVLRETLHDQTHGREGGLPSVELH